MALHDNHFAKLATNFTNYTKQPWSAITTTNQHYRKTFVKFVAGFFSDLSRLERDYDQRLPFTF
ncbi:MAG: hypothetical protein DMG10_21985 [Acidobacteria bacterium]|nr:MAG: hypothetical protein DMG10_21985 [Acidobacteriota bacterium]